MNLNVNSNVGLSDQLPYSNALSSGSVTKSLPEGTSTIDFFNIYAQEVKSIQLRDLFNEENTGATIGSSGDSVLDSFFGNELSNPLGLKTSGVGLLPFSQDKAKLESLGQTDFLSSIKLMEEVQSNTALIGKKVSYLENGENKNSTVSKIIIDNLVPYLVVSDGRHLKLEEVKEIEEEG